MRNPIYIFSFINRRQGNYDWFNEKERTERYQNTIKNLLYKIFS